MYRLKVIHWSMPGPHGLRLQRRKRSQTARLSMVGRRTINTRLSVDDLRLSMEMINNRNENEVADVHHPHFRSSFSTPITSTVITTASSGPATPTWASVPGAGPSPYAYTQPSSSTSSSAIPPSPPSSRTHSFASSRNACTRPSTAAIV